MAFQFESDFERRLHASLQRVLGTAVAGYFEDACRLLAEPEPFRSTTLLVAHMAREVRSAVVDVACELPAVKASLARRATGRDEPWGEEVRANVERMIREVAVPEFVAGQLRNACGGESFPGQVNAVIDGLGMDGEAAADLRASFVTEKWQRHVHRKGLAPKPSSREFMLAWQRFVAALAEVMEVLEGKFDAILERLEQFKRIVKPSKQDRKDAINLVPHTDVALRVFFDCLPAGWLPGLRESGMFAHPPKAERTETSIRFPSWVAGEYLARIAGEAPDEVMAILDAVPDSDNLTVHEQIVRVALQLDGVRGARIAEREAAWLREYNGGLFFLDPSLGELASKLARDGQVGAAAALLREMLRMVKREGGWRPEPKFVSAWEFEQHVNRSLRALGDADPEISFALAVELLREGQGEHEWSSWRAAVEDHEQNHDEPLGYVLSFLRDVCENWIRSGQDLHSIAGRLRALELPIFVRLAIHLVRTFGASDPSLVVELATDKGLIENREVYHELVLMLRDRLGDLDAGTRQRVLEAIVESERGHAIDGEEPPHGLHRWFWVLRDYLDADQRRQLDVLVQRAGEPEQPTLLSWWWVGGREKTAPAAAELLALPDGGLLELLRTWEPASSDFREPTKDDVASELRKAVVAQPVRLVALASDLSALDSEYFTSLVEGVTDIVRAGVVDVEVGAVLDLAVEVIGRDPRSRSEVLRAAIRLVEAMTAKHHPMLAQLATGLVRVVDLGLASADPVATDETERSGRDDVTDGINSVRGASLEAAIDLALHLTTLTEPSAETVQVRDMLKSCVEQMLKSEESPAVLSIVGYRFNALLKYDSEWACALAAFAFDRARGSAWRAYLAWCRPFREGFEVLRRHFDDALENLPARRPEEQTKLGEHLALLAGWGVEGLRPGDGRLERFIANAPIDVRTSSLETLGRAIRGSKTIDAEGVTRLQAIWSMWVEEASKTSRFDDLAAFGWWFCGPAMPADWLLSTLEFVLSKTGGKIDWDHEVIKKLARLVRQYPAQVAQLLRRVIEGGLEKGYTPYLARRPLRRAIARLGAIPEGRPLAENLVSRLAAHGMTEFRGAIDEQVPEADDDDGSEADDDD